MSSPVSTVVTRFAYGLSQLPRVAWYLGHGLALRRLAEVARRREGSQSRARRRHTDAPVPDRDYIYSEMIRLFMQDLANVEAGIYPVPADHDGSLLTMIHRSRLFFEDLPKIHRRRERRAYNEVLSKETRGKRPSYYLQNFHFQSGGWMTDDSAERYDTQVEVFLNGVANAIRLPALPFCAEAGRDRRRPLRPRRDSLRRIHCSNQPGHRATPLRCGHSRRRANETPCRESLPTPTACETRRCLAVRG